MIDRTSRARARRALIVDDERARATVVSGSAIHRVLVNFKLGRNDRESHSEATKPLRALRARNAKVPILMADRKVAGVDWIHFDEAWYGYTRFNAM